MPILANLAHQPIAYGVPGDDHAQAKAINTGTLNWAATTSYTLDTTQSNQLLQVQNIQTICIDNSNTTGITTAQVGGTGHVLRLPPGSMAVLPLITSDRPVLTISNTSGNGSTQFLLSNAPARAVCFSLGAAAAPNILANPGAINLAPWLVSGTGASATSATTLQTSAGASSLAQLLTVAPATTYSVSLTITCSTGTVFVAVYASDYSSTYGSQFLAFSGAPQPVTFNATIPAGVTTAIFELDFDSTAAAIATITGATIHG